VRIALDTNVLVSGLLSSAGAPADVLTLVAQGVLQVCYDERIMAEYEKVLLRPKFGFDVSDITDLLAQIRDDGIPVACAPLPTRLPDPDDEKFIEAAIAGEAFCLVSGNLKHYPPADRHDVSVLTPRELVDLLNP
jgi:putative PIN family toxin of toxin-antitoxin system